MGICRTDAEIVSGACGWVRADGRAKVHIHAEIVTEGGSKIALAAGGVAVPEGVIERLSAARARQVDIEPPGVLVGEPFGDSGPWGRSTSPTDKSASGHTPSGTKRRAVPDRPAPWSSGEEKFDLRLAAQDPCKVLSATLVTDVGVHRNCVGGLDY